MKHKLQLHYTIELDLKQYDDPEQMDEACQQFKKMIEEDRPDIHIDIIKHHQSKSKDPDRIDLIVGSSSFNELARCLVDIGRVLLCLNENA